MAGISTLTVNYRSHASILPEPGRMPEAKGQSDAGSDQPPSAMERPVRATADRLDNLGKALHSTAAAAKALSVPSVADPVDFAAGEEAVRDYFKARLDENHKVEHAARDVLAKGEASELPAHLAEAELQKLSALDLAPEPEVQEQARALMDDTLNQLQSAMPEARLASVSQTNIREEVLAKYSEFYKELNDIIERMGDWITHKNGGVEVSGEFNNALRNLYQKYQGTTLYTVTYSYMGDSSAAREQALQWADNLGLPHNLLYGSVNGNPSYSYIEMRLDASPAWRLMNSLQPVMDVESFQAWQSDFNSFADSVKNTMRSIYSYTPKFFSQLEGMIRFIKSDYLKVYENLLQKYSDFYTEFNQEIMAKMSSWITGKDDGKEVEISGGLYDALSALRKKYFNSSEGTLYPIAGTTTKDDATKWALAMGLITKDDVENNTLKYQLIVWSDHFGNYRVMIDLSPLDAMREQLPYELGSNRQLVGKDVTMDSAKFQSWQTGFNSNESDLKNQLQMFSTKYGSANSYYENFNKILSSQLAQYADMLKGYLS